MSANRLFLVCSHHPTLDAALCLAERPGNDAQYIAASMKRADDWFAKHQGCGRGCDHYQLAFHRPQEWDQPIPAEHTPAGAVRLVLAGSH
jgi:hypothetical protein